jgi:hypothetical protein
MPPWNREPIATLAANRAEPYMHIDKEKAGNAAAKYKAAAKKARTKNRKKRY